MDSDEPSSDSFLEQVAALPKVVRDESIESTDLGQYRIGPRIGRGGMGVVYRATDTKLRRTVAVKVLPSELVADAERRRRFLREARLAAATPHPNIAAVYEVGEIDGRVFLVMELVSGRTLRARIDEGHLEPGEAVRVATGIALGLARAHEAGIVHRDLKPENVMLGDNEDGSVKILDFGIAKLNDAPLSGDGATVSAVTTQEGKLLGTPAYMSPEQAKGHKVSEKSDVFSLGVVLYEMVTGARPFNGETAMEVLIAIDRDTPIPPSKLTAVPNALERAIARCLEKDPAKRPSIQELLGALEGLGHAELERKRAGRWALVLIACSVLTLGLVGFGIANAPDDPAKPEPSQAAAAASSVVSPPPPAASSAPVIALATPEDAGSEAPKPKRPAPTSSHSAAAIVDAGPEKPPVDLFHGLAVDAPF